MARLTPELKWSIVSYMKRYENASKCAELLKVSRETVLRWWKRYQTTNTVDCKKPKGRQPVLTPAAANSISED
jgi:transposase